MIKKLIGLTALSLVSTAAGAADVDVAHGKALVDANCYECHRNEVYTRPDRRVTSRKGLTTQVQRCELALGLKWFEDDVESAAEYLNQQFYRFK